MEGLFKYLLIMMEFLPFLFTSFFKSERGCFNTRVYFASRHVFLGVVSCLLLNDVVFFFFIIIFVQFVRFDVE